MKQKKKKIMKIVFKARKKMEKWHIIFGSIIFVKVNNNDKKKTNKIMSIATYISSVIILILLFTSTFSSTSNNYCYYKYCYYSSFNWLNNNYKYCYSNYIKMIIFNAAIH